MRLLTRLQDQSPEAVLLQLLGEQRHAKVTARVPAPRQGSSAVAVTASRRIKELAQHEALYPLSKKRRCMRGNSSTLLNKLRALSRMLASTLRTQAFHPQPRFPLLSVPAGYLSNSGSSSRRILAPVAFIPVQITAKSGFHRRCVSTVLERSGSGSSKHRSARMARTADGKVDCGSVRR